MRDLPWWAWVAGVVLFVWAWASTYVAVACARDAKQLRKLLVESDAQADMWCARYLEAVRAMHGETPGGKASTTTPAPGGKVLPFKRPGRG